MAVPVYPVENVSNGDILVKKLMITAVWGVTDYVVTRFAVLTVPAKRLQPDTKEPSQSPPRSHGRFTVAG